MPDRKAPVFVAATCNNVRCCAGTHPQRRFDEISSLTCQHEERVRSSPRSFPAGENKNPENFDLEKLARNLRVTQARKS